MPAMDRTGPNGMGPKGRGMGLCGRADASVTAQGNAGGGRGRGGGGRGRGNGNGACFRGGGGSAANSATPNEEAGRLEQRISAMQARVKALRGETTE